MRKSLIVAALASTMVISTQAMADLKSVLKNDIRSISNGNIKAEAESRGSSNSEVDAIAGVVATVVDASEGTDITTNMVLKANIRHQGDIEAKASNRGSINSDVSATAGVVVTHLDSGGQ